MQGAMRVEFGSVFPEGAYLVGEVRSVKDYRRSKLEGADVQEVLRDDVGDPVRDGSGEPVRVWSVEVDDANTERGFGRVRVKVFSVRQPVPPPREGDSPYRRIELVGLSARPWIDSGWCRGDNDGGGHKCRARLAWSFTAEGIRAPQPTAKAATAGNGRQGGSG